MVWMYSSANDSIQLDQKKWEEWRKEYTYPDVKISEEKKPETKKVETPSNSKTETIDKYVIIGIVVLILLVVVIAIILNTRLDQKVTTRVEAKTIEEAEENLPEVELNDIYQEAIDAGEFKKALRIRFLMVLQLLIDQSHITWKKRKTNVQFAEEIESEEIHAIFSSIVSVYDTIWYGEAELSQEKFNQTVATIQELTLNLQENE
jgi:uncharacterized membrane protein